MADHGWKYEFRDRWLRLFGTSMDSVEWSVRDLLKGFYAEKISVHRNSAQMQILLGDREVFAALFTGGICDSVWVEGERIER